MERLRFALLFNGTSLERWQLACLERLEPLTALREREYDYLLGEAFPRVLAEHGVALA